jgi:hypothetical protein
LAVACELRIAARHGRRRSCGRAADDPSRTFTSATAADIVERMKVTLAIKPVLAEYRTTGAAAELL